MLTGVVVIVAIEWRIVLRAPTDNGLLALMLDRLKLAAAIDGERILAGLLTNLPIGSHAPSFELAALEGPIIRLENLPSQGSPVLPLFADSPRQRSNRCSRDSTPGRHSMATA